MKRQNAFLLGLHGSTVCLVDMGYTSYIYY
jgi:hypothetical protein